MFKQDIQLLKDALGLIYSLPLEFTQDAHFCKQTSKNVRKFKKKYHLSDDGIVCHETWCLIMQVAKGIALKKSLQKDSLK
jgi:hypothetical protein